MPKKIFTSAESEWIAQIAIAYFLSHDTKLEDIPEKLGVDVSLGTIRNYIKKAVEDSHILRLNPTLLENQISDRDYEKMKRRYLGWGELNKRIAKWDANVQPAHVLRADSFESFSSMAAEELTGLLKHSAQVGVLGGYTLASIVKEYRSQLMHGKALKVSFTPLSGTCTWVLRKNRHELDASTISTQFEQVLKREVDTAAPVLAGVPAYIGKGQKVQAVKAFIESTPGYRKIFAQTPPKGPYPIINHIDTIITGIGAFGSKSKSAFENEMTIGEYLQERAAQEGMKTSELSTLVHGDIGGHLLMKEGLSTAQINMVKRLNDNWMGIQAKHFERVAQKANAKGSKRPGCVVIAYDRDKAKAIKAALKLGYIKNLILSEEVAYAMLKL